MTALGEQVTRDGDQVRDGTAVTLLTAAQMKVGPGCGEAAGLQPAAEERPGSGTRPPAERAGLEDTSLGVCGCSRCLQRGPGTC